MHVVHHHRPLMFTTPERLAAATAERYGWTVVSIDFIPVRSTVLGRTEPWIAITYEDTL